MLLTRRPKRSSADSILKDVCPGLAYHCLDPSRTEAAGLLGGVSHTEDHT